MAYQLFVISIEARKVNLVPVKGRATVDFCDEVKGFLRLFDTTLGQEQPR